MSHRMSTVDTDAIAESARDIQFRINQLIRDISQEHPSIRRAYLSELITIKEDSDNILRHVTDIESEEEEEEATWNRSGTIFGQRHQ